MHRQRQPPRLRPNQNQTLPSLQARNPDHPPKRLQMHKHHPKHPTTQNEHITQSRTPDTRFKDGEPNNERVIVTELIAEEVKVRIDLKRVSNPKANRTRCSTTIQAA